MSDRWTRFEPVRRKLRRAGNHIDELSGAIKKWTEGTGAKSVPHPEMDTATEKFFEFVPTETPDLIGWGIEVGQIAHLLRSSLDNLMWEITPRDLRNSQIGFPIFLTKGKWKRKGRAGAGGMIRHSPRDIRLYIKHVQPYHRRHAPNFEPLAFLHHANADDKHHVTVPVVTPFHGFGGQIVVTPEDAQAHTSFFVDADEPYKTLLAVQAVKPIANVQVKGEFTFGISLDVGLGQNTTLEPISRCLVKLLYETSRCFNAIARLVEPTPQRFPVLVPRKRLP